jgi:hypothetical protein
MVSFIIDGDGVNGRGSWFAPDSSPKSSRPSKKIVRLDVRGVPGYIQSAGRRVAVRVEFHRIFGDAKAPLVWLARVLKNNTI